MAGVKGQIQARGVERRRAIIEAAIECFGREGYRGTGLAAIAEQAGVTAAGVLHHFGTKENLLVEVLKQRDREAIAAFDDLGTDSLAENLARWVRVAEWNEERANLSALYTVLQAESIDPDHPAHEYFRTRTRTVTRWIESALRRGVETGEVRAGIDPAAKAPEIVALMEGAILVWLQTRRPGALRDVMEQYFRDQLRLWSASR